MSTFGDTLAEIDAHNYREQIKETWGHLAPVKGRKYTGRISYAVGCFGNDEYNPMALTCELRGLDSSPWFYDAIQQWMQGLPEEQRKPGCVYEWRGHFLDYEFTGQHRLLVDTTS